MFKIVLLALSSTMAAAFQVVGTIKPQVNLRASSPATMLVPDATANVMASFPSTMMVADNTLLLASGGLIGFIFLFAVVGTIVTNFGIMKK